MPNGGRSLGWRLIGLLERLGLLSTQGETSLGIRLLRAAHLIKPSSWRTFRKLTPAPLRTLWQLLRGQKRHTLLLPEPISLLISPSNLVCLVSVWERLPLAEAKPSENKLIWEPAPGIFLHTFTNEGIDLMILEEIFVRRDYGDSYEGMRVLDIGGYRGESTLFFLLRGAQSVVCVEPNPALLSDIRRHIEENGFAERVRLYPVAIGAETGQATFLATSDLINSTLSIESVRTSHPEEVSVPVWSFEQLLERVGWEEVDVAKLDCEGCEFGIFSSTPDAILRRVRVWIMEVHGEATPIVERLHALGYKVQYGEKGSLPGLLRAWQPGARLPWTIESSPKAR